MKCLNAYLLFTEPTGSLSRLAKAALTRHMARCPDCAAYGSQVSALEKSARQWRNASHNAALAGNIEAAVDSVRTERALAPDYSTRRHGRAWAGLAFAAVLIASVAVYLFVPAGRSAQAVAQDMAAAIAHIRNVHYTVWSTDYTTEENGQKVDHKFDSLQMVEQQWYRNGSWRKEGIYGSRLIIGFPAPHADGTIGTYYRYDSEQHRVISMGETGQQVTDFTLRGVIGPLYDSNPELSIVDHSLLDGRPTTELALTGQGGYEGERYVCLIDDTTNLPIQIDQQTSPWNTTQWTTEHRVTLDFNQNLPDSLFDPSTLKDEGWSLKDAEVETK